MTCRFITWISSAIRANTISVLPPTGSWTQGVIASATGLAWLSAYFNVARRLHLAIYRQHDILYIYELWYQDQNIFFQRLG